MLCAGGDGGQIRPTSQGGGLFASSCATGTDLVAGEADGVAAVDEIAQVPHASFPCRKNVSFVCSCFLRTAPLGHGPHMKVASRSR